MGERGVCATGLGVWKRVGAGSPDGHQPIEAGPDEGEHPPNLPGQKGRVAQTSGKTNDIQGPEEKSPQSTPDTQKKGRVIAQIHTHNQSKHRQADKQIHTLIRAGI